MNYFPIDEEIVRLAYLLILGREPESEAAVRAHLPLGTVERLRQAMMGSEEFQSKVRTMSHLGSSKWVAVDVLDSFIQWIDLHDRCVSYGCFNNNWEPSETAYLASRLEPGDTFLDIGANVGWFTLLAAKHVGPNGAVHAFEPRPQTRHMLKRTVHDNRLQNYVTVWPYALGDRPGRLNLVWRRGTENPGNSFLSFHSNIDPAYEAVQVDVRVLDDLIPDAINFPDVIKIDVEGAEPLVFNGAKKALAKKKPSILSELYPEQLMSVSGMTPAQYIQQMEEYGYKCYLLENGKPGRHLQDFPDEANQDFVSILFEWFGRT